ncbi:MAG TPA: Hsp20/alpha crystallin family protein [Patescibacteria group bacterium]|nr:Hsp20/alpha crystallin family protein [Patescibacteria group bacterium]
MNGSASISRRDPFNDISKIQEQMNRFLGGSFLGRANDSSLTTWAPEVDIHETEDALVLEVDLPGIEEKDLDIRVENNMLTVRGDRKFEKKVSEENYLRVERAYGSFSRSFSLPQTIDPDSIRADYRNGVLTIRVPKREEAKPKQVKVNVSAAK